MEITNEISVCFNFKPVKAFRGRTDHLLVFENEAQIRSIAPDSTKIRTQFDRGVIVTARGEKADFVSRFFAPNVGIDEDPVTVPRTPVLLLTGQLFSIKRK